MEKISILIVDDHKLVRETWSFILNQNPDIHVVGECGSGEEAVELSAKLRPQVVIMDINLPGINGIEATKQIRKYSPASKILCVSLHTQPAYAKNIMQNGALGYVTKNSSTDEMMEAIKKVHQGQRYICKEIQNIIAENMIGGNKKDESINSLSRREIEIISFIKKGLSSKEIASTLFISAKTVEVHRYNILQKLKLRNTASLVNFIQNTELEFG